MSKRIQIQSLSRAASFIPSTFNAEANTIEVVAATDAPVLVYNWEYGRCNEVLVMDKSSVRTNYLDNGMQLLDGHNTYGSVRQTVLGVVTAYRLEGGKLVLTLKFSTRDDLKSFVEDVKNGIYQNLSIGYRVFKAEVTEEEGKLPLIRCTDWEPYEVSFVAVPADAGAGVRNQSSAVKNDCEITSTRHSKPNNMNRSSEILKLVRAAGLSIEFAQTLIDDETIDIEQARTKIDAEKAKTRGANPEPQPAASAPAAAQDDEASRAAKKAERQRSSDILNAVRAAGLGIEFAEELIEGNQTVDQARAKIIEKLGQSNNQNQQTRSAINTITVGAGETERFREAAVIGLGLRSGHLPLTSVKPEEAVAGRSFQHSSLVRVAAQCLERIGVRTAGLSDMEVVSRAITTSTSDFPVIFQNVLHRLVLGSYALTADTWRRFCRIGSVTDFRPHQRLRVGSLSNLDKVGENGEIKTKALTDAKKESITASTKANIINVSRNMILNDDMGMLGDLASSLGRASARTIESDVYAALALNSGNGPTMSDGNPLFHASHGNIITGAAPSVASFDAIKVAMAKQKDHSNNDILDLMPAILVLGVGQGAAADAVNDSQYDPDAANKLQRKNTSYKTFRDIVPTARISGNEQYAFADPAIAPVLEVAFLNGVQTPYLEQEEAFTQLGMSWRVFTDYGVGAIDWKGAVKNPGA